MKRKRRDPRSGVLISDQVQKEVSKIEPDSMTQNIPSPVTESIPVIQEISSMLPESTPMYKDFQSPIIEEVVFPLKSSAEKDLIIGKRDIRISDFEKENSIKDAKISELQANLGGLTALFFNLNQRLHQKFGDDFQPLSVEG
ncbi:unnamed protein product [Lactuca virosa]|uniref:Uncharacterized protein n=1 Tax=Lactuca virosa TaxID=75947 RepID=A0AAU9M993_9ASTR|nr:unnamed protein product [Lactuca virosa]